jgi:Uma2 family endonuclease
MSQVKHRMGARGDSLKDLPIIADDMPVMFEDEGQEEMGESDLHTRTTNILHYGIKAHLAPQPRYQVFANLNLYYHPTEPGAYVSPDAMVTETTRPLPLDLASYRIGEEGPAPGLTAEVLSRRTYQQGDLNRKPIIYARLGIPEYTLVDVTGEFLPERLLLRRLQPDGSWRDEQDPDGGVTSQLGFRVVLEPDGLIRIIEAATGNGYARPEEAQAEADRARAAMDRVRELEEELARLRGKGRKRKGS